MLIERKICNNTLHFNHFYFLVDGSSILGNIQNNLDIVDLNQLGKHEITYKGIQYLQLENCISIKIQIYPMVDIGYPMKNLTAIAMSWFQNHPLSTAIANCKKYLHVLFADYIYPDAL